MNTQTATAVLTHAVKGRDGWEAETRVTLAGARVIEVHTYKTYKGLGTVFQVGTRDGAFISFDLMGDFKEYLLAPAGMKATEKSINTYHAAALAALPAVHARALAFYAIKDAKDEAASNREQAADQRNADFHDAPGEPDEASDPMDDVNYVGHPCHY